MFTKSLRSEQLRDIIINVHRSLSFPSTLARGLAQKAIPTQQYLFIPRPQQCYVQPIQKFPARADGTMRVTTTNTLSIPEFRYTLCSLRTSIFPVMPIT